MKKGLSFVLSVLAVCVMFTFSVVAYAQESAEPVDSVVDISASTDVKVTLPYKSVDYSGEKIKPEPVVTYSGSTLTIGTDYTVSYENNTNAGTASVVIQGKGKYKGTLTTTFTIKSLSISAKGKLTVTFDSKSLIYNNQKVIPKMQVVYNASAGKKKLAEGIDYTVSYEKNNTIGTAKAVINGIGNYTGKVSKEFRIMPMVVSGLKAANVTSSSLKLSWKKADKISGYQIAISNDGKTYRHLTYVSSKSTSYKVSNLTAAKSYKFKVRAYKTTDGARYFGGYSSALGVMVKPTKVSVTSITKNGSKLTVGWKKISCSGYEILYSTDKNMKKGVKTAYASASKTSTTIKGINKSKNYYVKVRAYKTYKGNKYYGEKSSLVSTKFSNVYAKYSSYYVNNANRTANLRLASKAISGTIIAPGETFSFNEVVGVRTASRGYKKAPVFTGGTGVENGIGGGICQVASTMFNCALKANVQITERHQHSQRVAYVPLGRDAAISGSAVDFKWTNTTNQAIQIKMTVKDGVITCTFYTCTKAKPKKVNIKVTKSGKSFTTRRYVDGKVNYTARSSY